MSVTRKSRSIVMTANGDEVTGSLRLHSLAFSGTGLTVGQQLIITESSSESVVASHYVENTVENVELNFLPRSVGGLKITAYPAAGTSSVIAILQ
jgi:hypothetical protein